MKKMIVIAALMLVSTSAYAGTDSASAQPAWLTWLIEHGLMMEL